MWESNMEQRITAEHWRAWAKEGCTLLPVMLKAGAERLPETWTALTHSPASVLLESAQGGRYTYVCDQPARVIVGDATAAEVRSGDGRSVLTRYQGDPLQVLTQLVAEIRTPRIPAMLPMIGGLIGVFGYDLIHTWEKLPWIARRDLDLPLYAFLEARELFIFDHLEHVLHVVVWTDAPARAEEFPAAFALAEARAGDALSRWRDAVARPPITTKRSRADRAPSPPPSFSAEAFQAAVRRIKDYIAAGDTYQVNLSLRTSRAATAPAEWIYDALRRINPSPYMGLLRLPEFALVCGSPELLVRAVDGVVSSRPIAGTRPRGDVPPQDSHFSAELFASDKERAEHLMLVDLIRNDLGRVADYGSVRVAEFMALERYSHVMHIVSQVEARLARGRSWAEVLRAMFPGGTITGCPKIRTMEIIEELEPVGRGFYTGALGWIGYNGAMEMNIVIRSMLVKDGVAHVQAGAGIVADSQPERELDESLRKAQALWVALEQAGAESNA
ncbi:anthranilate synthase component I family protein [Opitutus terrae]|uniref:Chorismate binding-like protein n=1 Tax=Opitutus terrae (strain DSM 11246 / JCM 15787 / PB90-1) TaxID=452637 RepID=B1ZQM4_OPITP|nr:anthranilate synthase component I family protein [Opitutus terrae]ACB75633.1 Chorismate binding-like protein [Opitutus terrae PB90-1]